jgi:hypothetical protein
MKKVWKSKDVAERTQLIEEINNDENTKELKKIYNKVLTNIKSVCPDLNKELGYKEWTPEVKARVQAWIDIVLSGNIPAVASDAPKAAENVGTQTTEPTVTATEEDSDDLPF